MEVKHHFHRRVAYPVDASVFRRRRIGHETESLEPVVEKRVGSIGPAGRVHQLAGEFRDGRPLEPYPALGSRNPGQFEIEQRLISEDGRLVEIGIIYRVVQIVHQLVYVELLRLGRIAQIGRIEREQQYERIEHGRRAENIPVVVRRGVVTEHVLARRGSRGASENRVYGRAEIHVRQSLARKRIGLRQIGIDTVYRIHLYFHLLIVGNQAFPEPVIHFGTRRERRQKEQRRRPGPKPTSSIHLRALCCRMPDTGPDIPVLTYPDTPESVSFSRRANPGSLREAPESRKSRHRCS